MDMLSNKARPTDSSPGEKSHGIRKLLSSSAWRADARGLSSEQLVPRLGHFMPSLHKSFFKMFFFQLQTVLVFEKQRTCCHIKLGRAG